MQGSGTMASTEVQKKAHDKWLREKVEDMRFRVPVGQKIVIQEHAKPQGESTNAFITCAAKETIDRDNKK